MLVGAPGQGKDLARSGVSPFRRANGSGYTSKPTQTGSSMTRNDDLHLIQYRDPETHQRRSTVLCQEHRGVLLRHLNEVGRGCVGTTAPSLSRCDVCHD